MWHNGKSFQLMAAAASGLYVQVFTVFPVSAYLRKIVVQHPNVRIMMPGIRGREGGWILVDERLRDQIDRA